MRGSLHAGGEHPVHYVLNCENVLSGPCSANDCKLHLGLPHPSEEFVYREIWFHLKDRATVIRCRGVLWHGQSVTHMNNMRVRAILISDQDSKVPATAGFVLHVGDGGGS